MDVSITNTENLLTVNKTFLFTKEGEAAEAPETLPVFVLTKEGAESPDYRSSVKKISIDGSIVYAASFAGIADGTYELTEVCEDNSFNCWSGSAQVVVQNGKITVTDADGQDVIYGTGNTDPNVTQSLTVKNYRKGSFVFIKEGQVKASQPEPLSGCTFTLTNTDTSEVQTCTSDGNGLVSFADLTAGTYLLTESRAAAGYALANGTITVEVDRYGKVTLNEGETPKTEDELSTFFLNKAIALEVEKKDDSTPAQDVKNAKMTLSVLTEGKTLVTDISVSREGTLAEDRRSFTWSTDGTGQDLTGLLQGGCSYRISETEVPYGYLKAPDITFDVAEDGTITLTSEEPNRVLAGETPVLTMTDTRIVGSASLKKVDSFGATPMEGVVFKLYRTTDLVSGSPLAYPVEIRGTTEEDAGPGGYVTDAYGTIMVTGLPAGQYYFVEVKTNTGFVPDSVTHLTFEITRDEQDENAITVYDPAMKNAEGILELTNHALNAGVILKKADASSGEPLNNAEFTVYKYNETAVDHVGDAVGIMATKVRQKRRCRVQNQVRNRQKRRRRVQNQVRNRQKRRRRVQNQVRRKRRCRARNRQKRQRHFQQRFRMC